jgi:hypothetical protein
MRVTTALAIGAYPRAYSGVERYPEGEMPNRARDMYRMSHERCLT